MSQAVQAVRAGFRVHFLKMCAKYWTQYATLESNLQNVKILGLFAKIMSNDQWINTLSCYWKSGLCKNFIKLWTHFKTHCSESFCWYQCLIHWLMSILTGFILCLKTGMWLNQASSGLQQFFQITSIVQVVFLQVTSLQCFSYRFCRSSNSSIH
jgi:hypothetical protein